MHLRKQIVPIYFSICLSEFSIMAIYSAESEYLGTWEFIG